MTTRSLRTAMLAVAAAAACAVSLVIDARVPAHAQTADIAQGDYIVNRVGMCIDCHGASLSGGPNKIPAPPVPGILWAAYVPSLRGLPMYNSDAVATKFMQTGIKADGKEALPPMPHIRLKPADADAVVAYLRSLK